MARANRRTLVVPDLRSITVKQGVLRLNRAAVSKYASLPHTVLSWVGSLTFSSPFPFPLPRSRFLP